MTCPRCGRKLTDPESIDRGMGPGCLAKEIEAWEKNGQYHFNFIEEGKGMRGFIYRVGTAIKDLAERIRNPIVRGFGIPGTLIRFGYWLRGLV